MPVDCRQGYSSLYSFLLTRSMSISISLIRWLDAFSHRQSLTCTKLSWQKHALHFLPGFWWLFSVRANNHPEIHPEAYRHGRIGKTCERRTNYIIYCLKWWLTLIIGLYSCFCFVFSLLTGSRNRTSDPCTKTWRFLVPKTSVSYNWTSTAQSSLGLPLWGNAVALCRLCTREAMEKRSGQKGKHFIQVILFETFYLYFENGAYHESELIFR